ncbi:hypothetical protein A4H97_00155 [Niastella yeongjuensis]|uniref:RNA polymerase sigma-70 factor n=1 Tax=Niastella yeongjuensis TaxID=354355 RepID=A0A1V9EVW2_9BACT|nr:sigma-70 family RNA polymerase sigma factor [Niastella yeongjuensis]OQP50296.1 hypothetical protein A4H97_00155 [Niastella yeongjuensis]SEN40708.1 RNA polymerase sigma-70 factor, ECF subfamily [Niastella yeongjuensis]
MPRESQTSPNTVIPPFNNDQEALFEAFVKATYPRVLAYLIKLSGQPEAARDICQDVYAQLWEKKISLPASPEEQLYYLFTMSRNAFFQYTRQQLRQEKQLQLHYRPDTTTTIENHPNNLELAEQTKIIKEALDSSEEVRVKFFLLNREEGLTYKQIAEREGVSEKTVERYIGSVIRTLRAKLKTFLFFFI